MQHRRSKNVTVPRTFAILFALVVAFGSPAFGAVAQEASPTSDSPFFNQADFERQLAQRSIAPEGPADQPWIQAIEPE